jgi:hypothetical protein
VSGRALGSATASSGIRAQKDSLLSVAEKKKFTMPPRRDRQSPDPEDREVQRRRGRQMADPAIERQMRDLRARLEDMETAQRCTASAGRS